MNRFMSNPPKKTVHADSHSAYHIRCDGFRCGKFSLEGGLEWVAAPTPTPAPGGERTPGPESLTKTPSDPNQITLVVTSQDAVMLNYINAET